MGAIRLSSDKAAADGVEGDRLVGAIAEAVDLPRGISRPFDNPADRPAADRSSAREVP